MEQTAQPTRPVMCDPEVLPEYYDEDGDGQNVGVGWNLSWGCKVTIGPDDDGQWTVHVSMSDEDKRVGATVRTVTREQVRDYAWHLLDVLGAENDLRAGLAEMDEGRRSAITLWQMAVRSQSTPPDRRRLAEIIAEKMGHQRSDDSPTCMDEDTTLGCRHAGGHPAEPGCDTCCEYGWPCTPALAAADAVLAAAHIVVPRSPVAVSTSVDGMSPAEWDARERVRRDGALAD
jgi:hypothetical protein